MIRIQVEKIVQSEELRSFYESQSNDSLTADVEKNGLQYPLIISKENVLIDGYRRLESIKALGWVEVEVIVSESTNELTDQRISANQYREKTLKDRVRELKRLFEMYPKKMGKRDGEKYDRYALIEKGAPWKNRETLAKVECIIENDHDDLIVSGLIGKKWAVEPCYEFARKFSKMKGDDRVLAIKELSHNALDINDIMKNVKQKEALRCYSQTFTFPEKVTSLNCDCVSLGNMDEYKGQVSTIMGSIPYWQLRSYEGDTLNQWGQEKTVQEYIKTSVKNIHSVLPLLKEDGNIFINVGETYDKGVAQRIPSRLIEGLCDGGLMQLKDTIVIKRKNFKPSNETVKRLGNAIEYLLWFALDPAKAKYAKPTFLKENSGLEIQRSITDIDPKGKKWVSKPSLPKPYGSFANFLSEQEVENVIEMSPHGGKFLKDSSSIHPARMGPLMPVIPILMTTEAGDLVCDPWSGQNTVGQVAVLLNRRVLTSEISHAYFQEGCEKLEETIQMFDEKHFEDFNACLN